MHSLDVGSEGCHFVFYWMIRVKVDCCVGGGWFSIYVHLEVCLLACYSQVQEVYRFVGFVCGIEFYIIMNLVYLCVNDVQLDFCCVIYDQNVICIPCV
jgi:hypothetical protein